MELWGLILLKVSQFSGNLTWVTNNSVSKKKNVSQKRSFEFLWIKENQYFWTSTGARKVKGGIFFQLFFLGQKIVRKKVLVVMTPNFKF